jgi:hypothetical protein
VVSIQNLEKKEGYWEERRQMDDRSLRVNSVNGTAEGRKIMRIEGKTRDKTEENG